MIFTIEPQIASTADIIFPSNFSIEGTKSVTIQDGATLKYRFWDVGTRKGASQDYKFTLMKDKLFTDRTRKSGHDYTVTQIRRNINNSTGRLITF